MAEFVFDKLVEKRFDLKKLLSITSDGAENMISHDRGMASELIKMADQKTKHRHDDWS